MAYYDYAIAQLDVIELALTEGRPLSAEAHRYLLDVCKRARLRESDPLGLVRQKGDRSQPANQLAMAIAVHKRIVAGVAPSLAYVEAGKEFSVEGTSDGAAAKAYRKHKARLLAADDIYAARKSGAAIPSGAIDQLTKEMRQQGGRNRRK